MANSNKKKFGLIGKNISYSFSAGYFANKFKLESLSNCSYQNYDLQDITDFPSIISTNLNLKGLNVTIPYKKQIIPYLDSLSTSASKIGAVNTIKVTKKSKLKGYNTDFHGFKKAIKPLLKSHHKKALILGTGGASNAVAFALNQLNIDYKFVSRNPVNNQLKYTDLNAETFNYYQIIVNCTPLGTFPDITQMPPLPYALFTKNHLAFDLIYNPEVSLFLKKAKEQGATITNGYQMLVFQAEKAWKIWNK